LGNTEMATKDRLIETASKIFSEYGFTGATTRMITKELGISLSAIPFYFGSKENLYKAVLERAANFTLNYLNPTPEQVQEAYDNGKLDRDTALVYLRELIEKQVDWSLGAGPEDIVRLIIREHTNPTQNGDIIYEVLFKCVIKAFALLIMTISGINDMDWAIIYSSSINGEILFFCEHRSFIEKALGNKSFQGPEGKRIREIVVNKAIHNVECSRDFIYKPVKKAEEVL
jgi:AcrR family transcriptional regulator